MTFHISLLSVLLMSEKILPALYLHKEEVMQQSYCVGRKSEVRKKFHKIFSKKINLKR